MSTALRRRPTRRALATAVTVVGATLALSPAPAAEAVVTGTVTSGTVSWGLSTYLNSGNAGRPNPLATAYAAPAAFDAATRISSWGDGTGLVAPDGSASLAFDGMSVNFAPTGGGWLKLTDVEATLDTSNNGPVTAIVTYGTSVSGQPGARTFDPAQPGTRGPERVKLVELAGNTAAERTLGAGTASWTGLDVSSGWSPELVDFVDGDEAAGIAPWTYLTTISNPTDAADRKPLPFSFSVANAVPTVDAEVTGAGFASGLTVGVTGDGFRAVTNPGDAGVYVGLAPSGGLPDVSTLEGMSSFAASDWVMPGRLATGAFTSTLTAPRASLDPTQSYSVYTWQAHRHSNPSQDTETPVAVDWTALQPRASTTVPGGVTTKVFGQTSTLTAGVPGPGSVTLSGVGPTQTASVSGGVASFTVPAALAVGSYTATMAYSGGGDSLGSQATRVVTVTRATPTLQASWKKKPTSAKKGKLALTVGGPVGVTAPEGSAKVKLSRNGSVRNATAVLAGGTGVATLPKLAKGTWKVVVRYAGATSYAPAKQTKQLKVKK